MVFGGNRDSGPLSFNKRPHERDETRQEANIYPHTVPWIGSRPAIKISENLITGYPPIDEC
jgi:hypothetical protein